MVAAWTDDVGWEGDLPQWLAMELGQIVPADGRVISGACEVDESALAGESLPAEKQTGMID